MKGDQTGADDRAAVPGHARDTESPSHQRADFNDPLPGGDPTAPGAPHEPGGEALTQKPNPTTGDSLSWDDWQKDQPGERDDG